jgi:F-type H+-transporting ATPase subunit b
LEVFLAAAGVLVMAMPAAAADAPAWRPLYDTVMMWVNFAILVALGVKFLKRPLQNFFYARRREVSHTLEMVEEDKVRIAADLAAARRQLEENRTRLDTIRQRIIDQGERRKQQIIEEAHQQSRFLLAEARHRMESRIVQARRNYHAQLVDAAYAQALERISREISAADERKLMDRYLAAVNRV